MQRRLQWKAVEAEQCARQEAEGQTRLARQREEAEARRHLEEKEAARKIATSLKREFDKEQTRLEREAAFERAEAARRIKAARLEGEWERKVAVAVFLMEHGFTRVRGPKRCFVNTTYPVHRAAKTGDVQMGEWLLLEGADPWQTNSAGLTAAQVARKHESKGSHSAVLRVLAARVGNGSVARAAGA